MPTVPVGEPTVFRGTLEFFNRLGVFDVLLPFLLVFTLVFAILQKTKIYGLEKIISGDKEMDVPRKNLNSMTAFVVAFFVVASSRLVAIIHEALAHVVILLIVIISFLLLVGAFHTGKEEFSLTKGWNKLFMVLVFIGVILIFLNATGILEYLYGYILYNWNGMVVSAIGLIIVVVVFIVWVTRSPGDNKKED